MFGRKRIKQLEDCTAALEQRVDVLERELVRLITAQKSDAVNAKQETAAVVSMADEEGEPWLKKTRVSR